MNLASELAGSDAISRIQARAADYWTRQTQRRLVATLNGIKAENLASGDGDMIVDISTASGNAAKFSASAVIQACATLGDSMRDVVAVGMHSKTYAQALQNDLIQTLPDSQGGFVQTFRGLAIIVDDLMPAASDVYTTVLFGPGAFGYGLTDPRVAQGTEVENKPGAGNGGGMQILHSRINLAVHPLGYRWLETAVDAESPPSRSWPTPPIGSEWERASTFPWPSWFTSCKGGKELRLLLLMSTDKPKRGALPGRVKAVEDKLCPGRPRKEPPPNAIEVIREAASKGATKKERLLHYRSVRTFSAAGLTSTPSCKKPLRKGESVSARPCTTRYMTRLSTEQARKD